MFHQRKNINRKESPHAVNEITAKCKMFIWPSKHNILVDYNWTVACILQPDFSLIYGAKVNDRQGQQKFLRDSELLSIPFCREGEKKIQDAKSEWATFLEENGCEERTKLNYHKCMICVKKNLSKFKKEVM